MKPGISKLMKQKILFALVFCLLSQIVVAPNSIESLWGSTDT